MISARQHDAIYEQLAGYTMIPRERFLENLNVAALLRKDAQFPFGSIVECGVWRGGMSLGFMKIFETDRSYVLCDSFAGLPQVGTNDGADAHWWAAHPEHPRYFNNCAASADHVWELIATAAPPDVDVKVVEGWFSETLDHTNTGPVALLHLDCDWYDSVYICFQKFWSMVQPGGVIIIDDYFDWEGCRRAVHDFLSATRAREAIERIGKTGGALIRRRGSWERSESPHLL